ncbi:hypothetical protein AAE478_004745 [Parahypoxylon ruwenzoriense]
MRVLALVVAAATLLQGVAAHLTPGGESQKVLKSDPAEGLKDVLRLNSSLAALIRQETQSPASCAACELKLIASRGDDFFAGVMTKLCKRAGVEDDDVCEGAISLEGPIIAHSLRGMAIGSKASQLACVAFMGLCPYPEVEPYDVPFLSPKPNTTRPAPSGREPLHVVHYSDIHIDPLYVVGANANCTKPICCREYSDEDKAGNNEFPAGPNGEHACDAPVSLEESMYAAIKDIVPDAAFSIFTGDVVDHAVWNTSQQQNTLDIEDAYARMTGAGMLVYGTAGNHEASPANSFPPAFTGDSEGPSQWVYDVLSSAWSQWIDPRAAAVARESGAYSAKHPGGNLRVISLSTNMYYGHNYWLYDEPMQTDPGGQLAWLVSELDAAERAGERVYIIGHMPMGSRDAFHDGSNYFDQIVNRYEATIAALFFGHTHYDEFEVSYAHYGANRSHRDALAMSYIAPSMTPMSGHPAFRVYTVDPVTFGVLDATTYIADTSDPSFQSASGPKWTKYYSAREAYGPLVEGAGSGELTPAFWHNVTEALERNATAFAEYYARRSRGWRAESCEDECAAAEICKLRAARAQDNCAEPGLRLDALEQRRAGRKIEEEECEASVIRDTIGSLAVDVEMLWALRDVVVGMDDI